MADVDGKNAVLEVLSGVVVSGIGKDDRDITCGAQMSDGILFELRSSIMFQCDLIETWQGTKQLTREP